VAVKTAESVHANDKNEKRCCSFKELAFSFSKKFLIFAVFDMLFFLSSLVIAYSFTKLYEFMVSKWVNAGSLALNAPKEGILAASIGIYAVSFILTVAAYFLFFFIEWKKATRSDTKASRFLPFSLFGILSHLYMFTIFALLFIFLKGIASLNNIALLFFGAFVFVFVILYISVYYVFSSIRFFEANREGQKNNILFTLFDTIKFSFGELKGYLLPFVILLISFIGLSFFASINSIASMKYLLFLFVFIYLAIFKAVYCTIYECRCKRC